MMVKAYILKITIFFFCKIILKNLGAVFCIDTYQNYLATGGEDDKAYV